MGPTQTTTLIEEPTFEAVWLVCPECKATFYKGDEVTCVLPFESLKKYYLMGRLTDEMFRMWVSYRDTLLSLSK